MLKTLTLATLLLAPPFAAFAEHPNCVIRDDPYMTCTSGTQWDAEIGGCMPVVTG
ncbi:hypothetical protein SAMN05444004_106127 [Jannaschia faecimaris]|uniref:Chitin binding Peritrophin-A domain-containing protein n=1 Tax=Jannaschia faecimaris TaxID=1244108 RepID=A0A1H3QG91_9RHOB|nr:adenylosuccinate lyase [Jannaschia faecimaris]SDZ12532.1 hypothetical protein SAMN05444004_106127 [Jannaschia faecimaris]